MKPWIPLTPPARPVRVDDRHWPIVATIETDRWRLEVRRNAGGAAIVSGQCRARLARKSAGAIVPMGADIAGALREVARQLGCPLAILEECLARLEKETPSC